MSSLLVNAEHLLAATTSTKNAQLTECQFRVDAFPPVSQSSCSVKQPQQSKGCVDRQLQPPPPGDDLPSLQKDRVLDQGGAGPKVCGPYPAKRPYR